MSKPQIAIKPGFRGRIINRVESISLGFLEGRFCLI